MEPTSLLGIIGIILLFAVGHSWTAYVDCKGGEKWACALFFIGVLLGVSGGYYFGGLGGSLLGCVFGLIIFPGLIYNIYMLSAMAIDWLDDYWPLVLGAILVLSMIGGIGWAIFSFWGVRV